MSEQTTSQKALAVFGRNIVRMREERRWGTADLADRAGLAIEVVATYERGEASATLADSRRLAKAFDVALADLVGLDEPTA